MKLTLRLESGTLAGRSYDLEAGFLTIGRSETCSIRFDPVQERIASKQHAFVEARADGFYIRDNQSTNGTYVNGSRVSETKLSNGDRIQFGRDGVTASVEIDGGQTQPNISRLEVQVFQQAAAATPPPSLQKSFANLALGSMPEVKPEPSKAGKYIGIGVTIFAIVFMVIFVALIMFASVGVVPAFIATFVAFIPAIIYLVPFLWMDRYDPEPFWLLALAFAWGALVSVIFSFFANTIFGVGVAIATNPEFGDQMGAVIAAPVFEEGSKGLGLVILLVFFRKYFDDILDGIVFAGVIALGFATVENVLYYGRAIGAGGVGLLLFLFVLRGIFSPFAHATFTSVTGIGCGIARESHKTGVRIMLPFLGYIGAVALHALWNGLATYGMAVVQKMGLQTVCENYGMTGQLEEITCAFPITYTIFQVPLFVFFMIFTLLMMRRQKRIVREMIAIDIARGLISQENADKATSAFRSTFWKLGGLFSGKYRARSRYVQAVGKLGLSYWHIQRATAAQGQTGSFQQNPILRDEILKWRDQV